MYLPTPTDTTVKYIAASFEVLSYRIKRAEANSENAEEIKKLWFLMREVEALMDEMGVKELSPYAEMEVGA